MPDYSSHVPSYTFPATLEAQEAALASNPLMQRLRASRAALADDPHRPTYHYVNPESTLNDPNGLCFWQGNWHLFYQAYPPEDPRQHWGHAVSRDLVHWRDLPYCIYPDPEEKCFSGSTLVEDDRVIAMYFGTQVGNMVATSSDPLLLNWTKVANRAVIPIAAPDGSPLPYTVYDPCIWKKEGFYYSLSGWARLGGPAGKPIRANFLFRSTDLEHWDYLHPFVEDDFYTLVGDDGSVPYFWPIGDRHILLFASHMTGAQYLLGNYDTARDKFVATHGGRFNFGPMRPAGIHAPSATPDGRGGVVAIFNMNEGKPTEGWNQIMSLPRRLTVDGDDLSMEPVAAVAALRDAHMHVDATLLPANEERVFESVHGRALELVAALDPQDAPMVELNVLRSPAKEEFTRIAFFKNRGQVERVLGTGRHFSLITIDTSYASVAADVLSRAPETAPVNIEPDESIELRVFVDHSVVEVFVNNKQCVAVRVYPERADSVGVSMRAQGAEALLKSLDAWKMRSIWS